MCSNVRRTGFSRTGIVLYVIFIVSGVLVFSAGVGALPLSDFYPFNASAGDNLTDDSDDGGSGSIKIGVPFPFFNRSHDKIFVNNNGIISFLDQLKTYRPENFPLDSETPIIAPFWADVDVQVGGKVWYRESSDFQLLEKATVEIKTYFPALRRFRANWMFIATWDNVGFYGASQEGKQKRNTFQAVLITDSLQSFVIFNYNKIEWTTGSNSGGVTTTGLGGNPAQAGFNAGDQKTYMEIPGARKNAVLNLTLTSNVNIPGKWVFRVDSATILGSCSDKGSGDVLVWPSSGLVLGGQIIYLSGPCFNEGSELLARFDDVNITFPCSYYTSARAQCITPTVFRTGPLTLSLNVDNGGWNYTGTYTTMNIAQVEPKVKRVDPKKWFVNQSVNISWDTSSFPSRNITNITVEVLEYKEVNGTPSLRRVVNFIDINYSSRSLFHFKLQNISTAAILKVSGQDDEFNGSAMAIWSDVFPARWPSPSKSAGWCRAWMDKEGRGLNLTQTEPCPCTRNQADGDTGRYQPDPFCNQRSKDPIERSCLYRGGATDCIMSNYQGSSEGSQVCCYSADGELLNAQGMEGGGTLGRYHYRSQSDDAVAFFSYFDQDVLPYTHCCQYSQTHCREFLTYHRPPVTCVGYSPPAAAQAAGDPHLVTLDGKGYTFNGEGEFVLLEDDNSSVVVQVRTAQARDTNDELQNATMFTAAAVAIRNVTDILEVRLDKDDIVQFLVNGKERDLTSSTSEFNGLTVYRNKTSNITAEVTVVINPAGVSVLMQATDKLLNIMVMVGSPQLKGRLRGLLGNYNGNQSDDFVSRNGTVLPQNASMGEIHYDFGLTWSVMDDETILTPLLRQDDPGESLKPVFIDSIDKENLRNGTEEVCGSNEQCRFDYQVTGDADIAMSTKAFSQRFEDRRNSIKPVVRCSYLDTVANGNRTVSGYTEGSTANFVCDSGYQLKFGDAQLVCQANSKWSGTAPACVEEVKVPSTVSPTTLIYIGAGTAGGVVVIILVVVVCVCTCRSTRKKRSSEEGSAKEDVELPHIFPPSPHIPTTVFANEYFLQSLHKLADSGSFKIPRPTYVDPTIYEEYF
ncbi:sushi domain-containing protein 2-like isoform X2 [Haliotis rufescens]|uniref:sushi domain-containing protein 2-like isoform X2 n=1 Tax=Haliotis rufescens TaxID=6454 RepID=UPI00201F18DA|nr:sushi domain-containing protein 2-like isoform X2 [Haliotis rufescens]